MKTRDERRPFRNSGIAYKPKKRKIEQGIDLRIATHMRKYYPGVVFHFDFAADADLSAYQRKLNSALQSQHKYPDLTILAARRGYCGLILEIKADNVTVILKNGKLTSDPHIRAQAKTLRLLNEQGYYANFAIGFDGFIRILRWYFGEPQQQELF